MHQLWIDISLISVECVQQKAEETKINSNIGKTNSKRQQKKTEGNRDSQRNGNEETEGARHGTGIAD